MLNFLFQLFFHLDQTIPYLITKYHWGAYLLLSLIIFLETAIVFLPFLPGDSLLFVAGTFASTKVLSLGTLLVILIGTAAIGGQINYLLGRHCSSYLLEKIRWHRRIKSHVLKVTPLFQQHGGSLLIWARFFPLLRTVVPFVAGITRLSKGTALAYNCIGAVAWISLLTGAGAYFGRLPVVTNHLTSWIAGILGLSILCALHSYRRVQRSRSQVSHL